MSKPKARRPRAAKGTPRDELRRLCDELDRISGDTLALEFRREITGDEHDWSGNVQRVNVCGRGPDAFALQRIINDAGAIIADLTQQGHADCVASLPLRNGERPSGDAVRWWFYVRHVCPESRERGFRHAEHFVSDNMGGFVETDRMPDAVRWSREALLALNRDVVSFSVAVDGEVGDSPRKRSSRADETPIVILAILQHRHREGSPDCETPMDLKELTRKVNAGLKQRGLPSEISDSKVSRAMKKLFPGGMKQYKAQFATEDSRRGFYEKIDGETVITVAEFTAQFATEREEKQGRQLTRRTR